MKRNFYLTLETIRRSGLRDMTPGEFIETVFPGSDVKDHLEYKLNQLTGSRTDFVYAVLDFYITLDTIHQRDFDHWFNREYERMVRKKPHY